MASCDIVHGRLKNFNILVKLAGEVKISEFARVSSISHADNHRTVLDESYHIKIHDLASQRRNVQALGDIVSELAIISDTDEALSSSAQHDGYSSELLEFINETNQGDLASLAQVRSLLTGHL